MHFEAEIYAHNKQRSHCNNSCVMHLREMKNTKGFVGKRSNNSEEDPMK